MTVAGVWPDVEMVIGVVADVGVAGIFGNVFCAGDAGLRVGFLVEVVGVGGGDLSLSGVGLLGEVVVVVAEVTTLERSGCPTKSSNAPVVQKCRCA